MTDIMGGTKYGRSTRLPCEGIPSVRTTSWRLSRSQRSGEHKSPPLSPAIAAASTWRGVGTGFGLWRRKGGLYMRIGICGAQGTGKRLLARMISQKLGLPLIEGTARITAREMGIPSEYDLRRLPTDELIDFEKRCLSDQIHSESLHLGGFVSARTVIDSAAYWLSWAHSGAPHDDRLWFITTARFHAKDYDLIVWSRPYTEVEIEFDGFRINDPL